MVLYDNRSYKGIWKKVPKLENASDVIYSFEEPYWGDDTYLNANTGKKGSYLPLMKRNKSRNICKIVDDFSCVKKNTFAYSVDYNDMYDVLVVSIWKMTLEGAEDESFLYAQQEKIHSTDWQFHKILCVIRRDGVCVMRKAQDREEPENDIYDTISYYLSDNVMDIHTETFSYIQDSPANGTYERHIHTDSVIEKFFGIPNITCNNVLFTLFHSYGEFKCPIMYFSCLPCKIHKTKGQQELYDKLMGYDFPELDIREYLRENYFHPWIETTNELGSFTTIYDDAENKKLYERSYFTIGVTKRVAEDMCVIRVYGVGAFPYKAKSNPRLEDIKTYEFYRIFISKDKMYVLERMIDSWEICNDCRYAVPGAMVPIKEEDVKGTGLEYLYEHANTHQSFAMEQDSERIKLPYLDCRKLVVAQRNVLRNLFTILRQPYSLSIFSQKGIDNVQRVLYNYPEADIDFGYTTEYYFGISGDDVQEMKRTGNYNLLKYSRISVAQIRLFDKMIAKFGAKEASNTFLEINHYFWTKHEDYLRHMNIEQYERLFNLVVHCHSNAEKWWGVGASLTVVRNIVNLLVDIYGCSNIEKYVDYVYNTIIYMLIDYRNRTKDTPTIGLIYNFYYDYLREYSRYKPILSGRYEWKFDSVESLTSAHDELTYIINMQEDEELLERTREKFDRIKSKWEKYLYQEDRFSVVAPKDTVEIAHEGLSLNHCVKSYIDDVLEEKTNILFVRKSGELSKPFYTLEIQDETIRQCHGYGNCNVCQTEGLEAFLKRFCKKTNVEYADTDRVLAAGR